MTTFEKLDQLFDKLDELKQVRDNMEAFSVEAMVIQLLEKVEIIEVKHANIPVKS